MCVTVAPIKSQPCYLLSRYASLYFCLAIENQENELLALEVIHRYVELLDKYFGNVTQIRFVFVRPTCGGLRDFHPLLLRLLSGVRAGYHLQLREGLLHLG